MTRSTAARRAILACAAATAFAWPGATLAAVATPAQSMVEAAIAGDAARLDRVISQLKSQSRPQARDRRLARELNERGLALWQRQRFAEAAAIFSQAHDADRGDAEIAENLGYALLRSGQITNAEAATLEALSLGPERASAWGTLGQIYAKQGKHREGVASMVTAYRFARDKNRTLDVYSRLARSDDDPKVRALLSEVVSRLSSAEAKRSERAPQSLT